MTKTKDTAALHLIYWQQFKYTWTYAFHRSTGRIYAQPGLKDPYSVKAQRLLEVEISIQFVKVAIDIYS